MTGYLHALGVGDGYFAPVFQARAHSPHGYDVTNPAEFNREIPRARGEAEEALRAAEGYAIERVNRAKGEADRFVRIYDEYRKAPDVTRRRIYLEAVADVLKRARQKVVVDESQKGVTPLLMVDGVRLGPAAATAKLQEQR